MKKTDKEEISEETIIEEKEKKTKKSTKKSKEEKVEKNDKDSKSETVKQEASKPTKKKTKKAANSEDENNDEEAAVLEKQEEVKEEIKENKEEKSSEKDKVIKILKEAKEKGNITYGELAAQLGDINAEEIEKVFDSFEELGVSVLKDDDFEYDNFFINTFIEKKVEDEIYLLEFNEDEEEW